MERIICDSFGGEKPLLGDGYEDFNKRVAAVNDMYGWLAEKGIIRKISFEYKEVSPYIFFAFPADQLKPFREEMLNSGVKDADLAVHHIFDEPYYPCMYSGAIQPGWHMGTYRSIDGCVGRSWECDLIAGLANDAVQDILDIKERSGVIEAVKATFRSYDWPEQKRDKKPSLAEQITAGANKVANLFKTPVSKEHER